MNMFFRELKAHRRSLIIWCVCMFLLVISGMGKYTAYSGNAANIGVFNDMPETLKALLGFGSFDVTTMNGYYGLLFVYIELAVAIHAVLIGSGIISKEERDKTTEFFIPKPVSRTAIITAKYLAALFNITVVNIVTFVCCATMVSYYNKGDDITGIIAVSSVAMFIVQLLFITLGAALASSTKHPKASGAMSSGILLGSFFIAKLTDLVVSLKFLNFLSPFKYFDLGKLINNGVMEAVPTILSILLSAFFVTATYLLYKRRDMAI